jgi:hypothetical protein
MFCSLMIVFGWFGLLAVLGCGGTNDCVFEIGSKD